MAVAFHSESIEIQEKDDTDYVNVETKTTAQKETPEIGCVSRRYGLVGLGLGLLCVVQALLNIGLRLSLYPCNMVEGDQLATNLSQACTNLTEERDHMTSYYCIIKERNDLAKELKQIKTSHSNLTVEKEQLQFRFKQLEIINFNLTENKELLETRFKELQIRYKNLTEDPDAVKRILCESSGFTFREDLCYYISTGMKNWEDSRKDCKAKQSDLMIIKSQEKQDFVASLNKRMWIGLTDRDQEGTWKWVDGTPLTLTFWNGGEPNNAAGVEDCAEIFYRTGWNDNPCLANKHWICERVVL